MSLESKKLKLIAVDEENYQALRMMGHTSDSFNDVITRILKENKAPTVPQVSSQRHPGASHSGTRRKLFFAGGTPNDSS